MPIISREENLLSSIANSETPQSGNPKSRNEVILQAIIDGTSMSELPSPRSREEKLLMEIGGMIESGGGSQIEDGDVMEF